MPPSAWWSLGQSPLPGRGLGRALRHRPWLARPRSQPSCTLWQSERAEGNRKPSAVQDRERSQGAPRGRPGWRSWLSLLTIAGVSVSSSPLTPFPGSFALEFAAGLVLPWDSLDFWQVPSSLAKSGASLSVDNNPAFSTTTTPPPPGSS